MTIRTLLRCFGAFALIAGVAAPAHASYTLQTSVTGVTYAGPGSITSTAVYTSGQSFTISTSGGSSAVVTVGAAGASSYTDSAGTTVYFLNDMRSPSITGIANEQIFVVSATNQAPDTATFTFTTNIAVGNGGATGTFALTGNTISLNYSNGDSNYKVLAGPLTPTSLTVGGSLYNSSLPQATSGNYDSISNGGLSATITSASGNAALVPEPASLALLGLGLVGLGGVMASRRRSA